MTNAQPRAGSNPRRAIIVYVLEADEAVRGGLDRLLSAAGMEPRPFASPQGLLEHLTSEPRGCLLVDMTLPGTTAAELRARLSERGIVLPVIATSVRDDEQVRRSARELGARLFLVKPVDDQALLDAIEWMTEEGDAVTAVE